jgi:hypothetical protein
MVERKEERIAMTVYFPQSLWEIIEDRIKVTGRSKNGEAVHLMQLGLKYGQEADVRALSLLMRHLPTNTEQP